MQTIFQKAVSPVLTASVFVIAGLAMPYAASASNPVVEIEGMEFQVNQHIHSNLHALQGKRVGLMLDSGAQVSGRIKAMGQHLVHLENLGPNKDFMDALIAIDRIVGIEVQARGYLRDLERAGLKAKQPSKEQ